ncbi:MAG TPA: PadR family transcriptional regulator [Vicinamibacterales bacterium]|nr:PadR family transcriptional regulator [Vicinamibacterales bacterium]
MAKQLSVASLTVLHAVASGTSHGFDIIDATDLPGGTVYPALSRLERDGLVVSDWEDVSIAREEGRPPRRYYAVTSFGLTTLNSALARLHALKPVRSRRPSPAR